MSDPFIAEIRIFANSFAPRGWATCDGQQIPIAQNTTLYSLIGVIYGGNGTTNFNLPNLGGRVAVGQGQGPGLTNRPLGGNGGETTHLLTIGEMASHPHDMKVNALAANSNTPDPSSVIARTTSVSDVVFQTSTSSLAPMNAQVIGNNGGNNPHNNMQPYLTFLYAIALQGTYPQRP